MGSTTGSILLSTTLDHMFLGGPFSGQMVAAGGVVMLAICNYTFDQTPITSKQIMTTVNSKDTGAVMNEASTLDKEEDDIFIKEESEMEILPLVSSSRNS